MTFQIDWSLHSEPVLIQLERQGLEPIDDRAEHILFQMDGDKSYLSRLLRAEIITIKERKKCMKRMRQKIAKLIRPCNPSN